MLRDAGAIALIPVHQLNRGDSSATAASLKLNFLSFRPGLFCYFTAGDGARSPYFLS